MRIVWCDQENTSKDKWKFQLYSWQLHKESCVALKGELQTVISKDTIQTSYYKNDLRILRESKMVNTAGKITM